MMIPESPYRLSAILQAHDYDVKALAYQPDGKGTENLLASCSRDGQVKLWGVTEANEVSQQHAHHAHLHFVNTVAILPPTETHPCGLVASGGADNNVRLLDVGSREMAGCLSGHTNNVCALAAFGRDKLVSGSWDGAAIIWDVEAASALYTLYGHSNAVWCLLAHGAFLLTGSADKTIKLWKGKECIKTFAGHTDCVRALALLDGARGIFASAGNDNTIKIWSLDGSLISTIENAHDAYIYSLSLLENGLLASAGEDGCVKLWDWPSKKCVQSIRVPATSIWTVQALDDGDFTCGTDDGYIYMYSAEPARQIFDEALLEVYEDKLKEKLKTSVTPASDLKVAAREHLERPGAHNGQHIIVRSLEDPSMLEAHQWDGHQWSKLGDVIDKSAGAGEKKEYNGQLYDYVFDVQVEDGPGGSLKLPFNLSENPYTAAQAFVARNDLPPSYVDQIVDFILKNTDHPFNQAEEESSKKQKKAELAFPDEPVRLANANLDGILKKISEFNSLQPVPLNLQPVQDLVDFLKIPSKKKLHGLPAVFDVFAHWPVDRLFPVLDLVRVTILNDVLALELADFIQSVCVKPIITATSGVKDKIAQATTTMQLRILANSFQCKKLWPSLKPFHSDLIKTLHTLKCHKDPLLPCQALFNLSLMLSLELPDGPNSAPTARSLLALLLEHLQALRQPVNVETRGGRMLMVLGAVAKVMGRLPKAQMRTALAELEELRGVEFSSDEMQLIAKLATDITSFIS